MTLEQAMRNVIVQMTLIQYGSTQSWGRSSGDGDSPGRPSGESAPLAVVWAGKWEADPTEDTLVMARAELDAWKRSVPRDDDTPDWQEDEWVLADGENYSAEQVARRFNTTPSRVRSLRVRNGREMEFGLRIDGSRPAPKLTELVERGLGARQISMLTGVKRATAQDAINRHRKVA